MKPKTMLVYVTMYDDEKSGVTLGSIYSNMKEAEQDLKESAKDDADYYDIPLEDIELDGDSYYIERDGEFLAEGHIESRWMEMPDTSSDIGKLIDTRRF